MIEFSTDKIITFWYTNYKGEREHRTVLPEARVTWEQNDFHGPKPHWLFHGLDLDRGARRSFLLSEMEGITEGSQISKPDPRALSDSLPIIKNKIYLQGEFLRRGSLVEEIILLRDEKAALEKRLRRIGEIVKGG